MKKIHIIGIILIAVAIGAIMTAVGDASTYVDFASADKNPGKEFHVIGTLNREKEMIYDPQRDPNEFIFYAVDTLGTEKKVILHKSKPQDFEKSEKIVMIGKSSGKEFHAKEVLMKCPSKYNDRSTLTSTSPD